MNIIETKDLKGAYVKFNYVDKLCDYIDNERFGNDGLIRQIMTKEEALHFSRCMLAHEADLLTELEPCPPKTLLVKQLLLFSIDAEKPKTDMQPPEEFEYEKPEHLYKFLLKNKTKWTAWFADFAESVCSEICCRFYKSNPVNFLTSVYSFDLPTRDTERMVTGMMRRVLCRNVKWSDLRQALDWMISDKLQLSEMWLLVVKPHVGSEPIEIGGCEPLDEPATNFEKSETETLLNRLFQMVDEYPYHFMNVVVPILLNTVSNRSYGKTATEQFPCTYAILFDMINEEKRKEKRMRV